MLQMWAKACVAQPDIRSIHRSGVTATWWLLADPIPAKVGILPMVPKVDNSYVISSSSFNFAGIRGRGYQRRQSCMSGCHACC